MSFRPTDDRILVDQDPVEEKTSSGFFIPVTGANAVNRGTVISVGPGRYTKNGDARIPIDITVNDRVLFAPGSGLQVKVEGVTYLILKEDEILAIVQD